MRLNSFPFASPACAESSSRPSYPGEKRSK
jgi:hypothetical protein